MLVERLFKMVQDKVNTEVLVVSLITFLSISFILFSFKLILTILTLLLTPFALWLMAVGVTVYVVWYGVKGAYKELKGEPR